MRARAASASFSWLLSLDCDCDSSLAGGDVDFARETFVTLLFSRRSRYDGIFAWIYLSA